MPVRTQVSRIDHVLRRNGTRSLGIDPAPQPGVDPVRLLAHWALAICLAPALLAALLVGGLALVIQSIGRVTSSLLHLATGPFRSR